MASNRWMLPKAVLIGCVALSAWAEVTDITGTIDVSLTRTADGVAGTPMTQSVTFEQGSVDLLEQASVKHQYNVDEAAAIVAGQFATPDLTGGNPEDFAFDLALSSVVEDIYYEASGTIVESRTICYSASDLSATVARSKDAFSPIQATSFLPGSELQGRLYLDGVLAILANDPTKDLSNAYVELTVTIEQRNSDVTTQMSATTTVFESTLLVSGTTAGGVNVSVDGDIPTNKIITSDLDDLSEEFGAINVVVLPNIQLDFPYTAIAGVPFDLIATIEVNAANVCGETAVVAVLGNPISSILDVIGTTDGQVAGEQVSAGILSEWESPTGNPAFQSTPMPAIIAPCGMFGVESLLGVVALFGLKFSQSRRR